MEKSYVAVFSAILVLIGSVHVKSDTGYTTVHGCSNYTFHQNSEKKWYDWFKSRKECTMTGYDLVTIESREEWNFLNQSIQTLRVGEYFIGLKKDKTSGDWRWISDNSKVNASTKGAWPWATREPSNDPKVPENCAKMFKDYWSNYVYDDVQCERETNAAGYICERTFECIVEAERPDEPPVSQTSLKELPTRVSTTQTSQSSNSKLSTPENQLTFHLYTKGLTWRGLTREPLASQTSVKESPTMVSTRKTSPSSNQTLSTVKDDNNTITCILKIIQQTAKKDKPSVLVILLASTAALLFVMLVILSILFLLRGRDTRHAAVTSDQLKDQNTLALSPFTEARQDALPDEAQSQRRETEQHAKQECAYAMLTPRTNTVSSTMCYYTSLVKTKEGNCGSESPVVATRSMQLDHPYDEPPEYANQLRPSEYMNI